MTRSEIEAWIATATEVDLQRAIALLAPAIVDGSADRIHAYAHHEVSPEERLLMYAQEIERREKQCSNVAS